jgi:hypothetical protein
MQYYSILCFTVSDRSYHTYNAAHVDLAEKVFHRLPVGLSELKQPGSEQNQQDNSKERNRFKYIKHRIIYHIWTRVKVIYSTSCIQHCFKTRTA